MSTYKGRLDGISVIFSLLCIVHCILLPVFLTTLPLWKFEILENAYIEISTILISLLVGGWAIFRGYRKHHRRILIPILFVCGIGIMIVANFFTKEFVEMLLKGTGALIVITSHMLNLTSCQRCIACEDDANNAKNCCM